MLLQVVGDEPHFHEAVTREIFYPFLSRSVTTVTTASSDVYYVVPMSIIINPVDDLGASALNSSR